LKKGNLMESPPFLFPESWKFAGIAAHLYITLPCQIVAPSGSNLPARKAPGDIRANGETE
jgi:hypothetical protein